MREATDKNVFPIISDLAENYPILKSTLIQLRLT